MRILHPRAALEGEVTDLRARSDGSVEAVITPSRPPTGGLPAANRGVIAAVFLRRDAGHLTLPSWRAHVRLVGALVMSGKQRVLKRVFSERIGGRRWRSGPQFGAGTRPTAQTAASRAASGQAFDLRAATGRPTCQDFATRLAAQSFFEAHRHLPGWNVSGLDNDHDGSACDALP